MIYFLIIIFYFENLNEESLYLCRIAKHLDLYKNDKYPWSIIYKTKNPNMYYLDTSNWQSVQTATRDLFFNQMILWTYMYGEW